MEYHEIGEMFEFNGVELEVIEGQGDTTDCISCYFRYPDCITLKDTWCNSRLRSDKSPIYYKLVEQCKTDYTWGNTNSKVKILGGLAHLAREEERKEWNKLPLEAKCNKTKDMQMDLEFHDIDYHDIGERFNHYGVTLEVKENTEKDKRKSCDLCYIQRICSEIKHSPKPPIRNCSPFSRKDRKSVYYVHVEGDYEHKTEQVETKDMEQKNEEPQSKNNSIKNDRLDDKLHWELLPLEDVEDIVRVYTAGAKKYGENKWQDLPDGIRRYKAALLRHLVEFDKGNEIDKETGCLHLAQVAWNAIAMLHISKKQNNNNESNF